MAKKTLCTIRAYASGWKSFLSWCAMAGRSPLPASVATVSDYVLWCINEECRLATIGVRLNAISHYHKAEHLPTPVGPEVREIVRMARRLKTEAPGGKAALTYDQLAAITKRFDLSNPVEVRNKALLLLGFAAGWRRSEIIALQFQHVQMVERGMTLFQARSKVDQESKGRLVGIDYGKRALTCPVRAMQAWIALRGTWNGPLFTRVHNRVISRHAMHERGEIVHSIVKRGLTAIGEDPARYGAHSLRAGMITVATEAGASEASIMQRTGHQDTQTLQRYIRPAKVFSMNPLAAVL